MYRNVILTGGTSVFNQNNVFYKKTIEENIFEIKASNPILKNKDKKDEEVENWILEMKKDFENIDEDSKNISAEFSVIIELKKQNKLAENSKIVIFYTDSLGGELSALINKDVLEYVFDVEVEIVKTDEFNVGDKTKINNSMSNFLEKLGSKLKIMDKYSTFFAPIGGYKIMTYLGYIAGSFYGHNIGYIFEGTQKLIEIPTIPIKIDYDLIYDNLDFIQKVLKNDISIIDSNKIDEFIQANAYFFEKEDNMVSLNAFGKMVFENILNTKVLIGRKVYEGIDKNIKKVIGQGILGLISKNKQNKLTGGNDFKNELYHNANWNIKKPYLYKGKSGDPIFRAVWDYDEEKDELKIYKFWTNHDKYESECEKSQKIEGYILNDDLIEFYF